MNKDKLQQELLAKIKPGMKPSDLKKQKRNIKSPKDEGYSSGEEKLNKSIPKAPPLPNQSLLDQIASLKKQLQVYQDFKEADLKIKEKLKEELATKDKKIAQLEQNIQRVLNQNTTLSKIIGELQAKNQELTKTIETLKNPAEPKENIKPKIKTFLCSECQQTKPQTELSRVFGS